MLTNLRGKDVYCLPNVSWIISGFGDSIGPIQYNRATMCGFPLPFILILLDVSQKKKKKILVRLSIILKIKQNLWS